jgi:hypothetical protein
MRPNRWLISGARANRIDIFFKLAELQLLPQQGRGQYNALLATGLDAGF